MEDLIGNTPLLKLKRYSGLDNLYGKLEMCNPSGSAKDRPALEMLNDFEARGLLT